MNTGIKYKEQWRDIVGYEGLYKISNKGRVKSFKFKKPSIIGGTVHKSGHHQINLIKDSICKTYLLIDLYKTTFQ